jgi:hypothetical protein
MKDIFTRLTFGFLMAQAFPGAIAAFALTFAHAAIEGELPKADLRTAVEYILDMWNHAALAQVLFLLGLCIGLGMFIHGVHWAILGMLEKDTDERGIFMVEWHRLPVWRQFFLAPVRLVKEICMLFWQPHMENIAIKENVASIDEHWTKQHEFMQDFYLYPAQFFAHTAFSLALCFISVFIFIARYSFTWRRGVVLLLLYLALCSFFTLARAQLCSLFSAERTLMKHSRTG